MDKTFDGDILNMVALVTAAIKHMFRKFDPVERYMLSRTTGQLDHKFGVTSTDIVNIYNFATMKFPEAKPDEVSDDKLDDTFLPYIDRLKEEREARLIREKIKQPKKFPKIKIPDDIMM